MDVKTVPIPSFVLCILLIVGVKSSDFESTTTLRSLVSTVPTNLPTKNPDIESSESKVVNNYGPLSEAEDDFSREDDVEGAPPDHIVPYSEHENPAEPRPPKFPPNIQLDFVPTKLYAQVRKTHTVKRLPREEALESATNEEEILAAPRLRQVVSKSKKNTVYTEEGYEDAAYDHGGHIRDADFHEDHARRLGDQEDFDDKEMKPNAAGNSDEEEKEGEKITSAVAEELNVYDDDYRDHDSSIIKEFKSPNKIKSKGSKKSALKNPWKDTLIDAKRITENEIERLEEDLEKEYEESEKNTETEVPDNLRNLGEDDEEEDEGSVSEADALENQHHEKNLNGKHIDPGEASAEFFDNSDSMESGENEIRDISLPKPKAIENVSTSVDKSADYGKIFWDYFKSLKNNEQSQEFITPSEIDTTLGNSEKKSVAEAFTMVPRVESVQTTLAHPHYDSNFPSAEFGDFFLTSRMDRPSAASAYESWKRQDQYENSEGKEENDFLSVASYTSESDEKQNSARENDGNDDGNPSLNLQNVGGSTTLISPKKLSYTVIIRPSEKPTTKNPPCDCQVPTREGETPSNVKSALREPLRPEAITDFSFTNDFTAIQPPLPPVPLTQVTYTDFMPVSYASLARPTVTREIGSTGEEINNNERDRYESMKNSYANHGPNLRPRYHRFRNHKKKPHNFLPPTKLVPPSPINRSAYSDYFGVKRIGKPIERLYTRSNYNPWPGIMRFYSSFGRKTFGRYRRSLHEEAEKGGNETQTTSEGLRENKWRLKRNSYRGSNRFAGTDNAGQAKSIGSEKRKRRNDGRLLHEAPEIVDQVINNEIEARFKEEVIEGDENTEEGDGRSGKLDIEVPDFNFSEVIDDNESEKVVKERPTEGSILNTEKYPFYENSKIPRSSALKYITNPRQVPKKTLGGTEFYDSRDRYRRCDEVEPDLESVLPEEEQPSGDRGSRNDGPRLRGLGDALECFRAKYFDDDPLDNPLFLEEQVGQPTIPEELLPARNNFRYFEELDDDGQRVVGRVSRKPELIGNDLGRSESKKQQFTYNDPRKYRAGEKDSGSTKSERNVGKQVARKRRKRRRKRPRTTTAAPAELPATPYQHQVYEDVMGTIKNLAGLYQTFGEPIASHSSHPDLNYATTDLSEKNIDSHAVHVTERPRGLLIRELSPRQPTESSKPLRYRIIPYRTNRVTYRTRTRTERPPGDERTRVGYFRTVTVHKRSVSDDELLTDLDAAGTRSIGRITINNGTNNASKLDELKYIKVEETPAASERVVYTIRDRIRHSKPRGIFGKHGKFTNLEASATEDVRRHEPRYNRVRRKKFHPSEDEPITTVQPEDGLDQRRPLAKNFSLKSRPSGRLDFHDEPGETYKIQYSTTHGRRIEPGSLPRSEEDESSEGYEKKDESTVHTEGKKQQNEYDVRENFKEDITTVPSVIESTEKPEFFELRKYLQTDPPGYSEAFDEESNESSSRSAEDGEPQKSDKFAEAKREESEENADEDENEEEERQVEKPMESHGDEESSSKSTEDDDSSSQGETYRKSDDSEENEETEEDDDEEEVGHQDEGMRSPQVEDTTFHVEDGEKEFERFASRPFSPFESYEDPKYMDLGPRLSKPSFHHPSFSSVNNRRKKYSRGSNDDESNENVEKSRYVFPWSADRSDEEDDRESRERSQKIERYEYPWERRERLARERRRRAKQREEHLRLYGFSDDSGEDYEKDEEEAGSSNTRVYGRLVYPWEHYRVPSKNFQKAKAARRTTDNAETSSNHRPRFSSRYKTRNFHINKDNDPIAISGTNPQGIKKSWLKSMEKTTNTTTSSSSTLAPAVQKGRRSNLRAATSTTPSTISSTTSNRKIRNWRIATTTKKPVSLRGNDGVWNEESLQSESRKDEVVTGPVRRPGSNSSLMNSLGSTLGNPRKFRRRSQMIKQSTSLSTTTERPLRSRFQRPTPKVEGEKVGHEESTVKSTTEKDRTPEVKTIEHRSRFSKEEIITKTSYPTFVNNNNSDDTDEQMNGKSPSDPQGKFLNETIKKVSITTKETPDHIYRTEEIDKDGVKGMFVSITPNNGTNSSINVMQDFDRDLIDPEERRELLNDFQHSKEHDDEEDQISFMGDSHVLAKLLMQVPPYEGPLPESMSEGQDIGGPEGSGSFEDEVDQVARDSENGSQTHRVKNPGDRLYYYVEDS